MEQHAALRAQREAVEAREEIASEQIALLDHLLVSGEQRRTELVRADEAEDDGQASHGQHEAHCDRPQPRGQPARALGRAPAGRLPVRREQDHGHRRHEHEEAELGQAQPRHIERR